MVSAAIAALSTALYALPEALTGEYTSVVIPLTGVASLALLGRLFTRAATALGLVAVAVIGTLFVLGTVGLA